jgi:outer membrane protein OmpA-like peptidoglycan-associated protein
MLAAPLPASVSAQQPQQQETGAEDPINVYGTVPADLSGMPAGPEIQGIISARNDNRLKISASDGTETLVDVSAGTQVRGSGGFLGLGRTKATSEQLLNGLPVTIQTVRWGDGLVAKQIRFKKDDLQTAAMIRGGTAQRFAQVDATTEALRTRFGDIDKYNVKNTQNVYFDTAKWNLSPEGQAQLCAVAEEAKAMDNALLLVVGYTDSVGDEDYNQELSEKRAARVVNFLQQRCGWAPYRMLTPTGMAESDPAADESTPEGRAQNRRVSVNVLVSKAVDAS